MKRRSASKRSRELKRAKRGFREAVLERDGHRCLRASAKCAGFLDAHHVIRDQALRQQAFQLGLRREEGLALRFDPDVGVTTCRFHHDQIHRGGGCVYYDELPSHVLRFASEHDLDWWLDRFCPVRILEAGTVPTSR